MKISKRVFLILSVFFASVPLALVIFLMFWGYAGGSISPDATAVVAFSSFLSYGSGFNTAVAVDEINSLFRKKEADAE